MQRSPVNGMDFLWMLLVLAGELGILFELLHLAWTTHYYLSNTDIPHAICRPGKLKLSYFVLIWLFSLVSGQPLAHQLERRK